MPQLDQLVGRVLKSSARVRKQTLAAHRRVVRARTRPKPRITVRRVATELPACARPSSRPGNMITLWVEVR
jgi:hypothetical protein